MSIPSELKVLAHNFFLARSDEFDLTTNEGCGQYMEAFVEEAQNKGYEKVGHLRKHGSATQYNGHANDAFLYREPVGPDGLYQAVDIIANAESKPPYTPSHQPPASGWSVDEPRYKDSDWYLVDDDDTVTLVLWVPYNEQGFERLKRMLKHDYERRPQGADFDVSVWSARFFHNHYMGPEGVPLSEQAALERVKVELCAALGIPLDDYYG